MCLVKRLYISIEKQNCYVEDKGRMSLMRIILTLFNTTDSVAESRMNGSMINM